MLWCPPESIPPITVPPLKPTASAPTLDPTLEDLLSSGFVEDEKGNRYSLHSNISLEECLFIANLIDADLNIKRCLEIGCAYGIGSLAISTRVAKRPLAQHVIIDPNQFSEWHGIGLTMLKRAGIDFFQLVAEPSEYALPRLCQSQAGSFDLAFIDGWHTFDHTIVDMFYADRLIREGGYIVIDDATMASVSKAVSYLSNYPGYRIVGEVNDAGSSLWRRAAQILCKMNVKLAAVLPGNMERARFGSMVALQKTKEMPREWNWYRPF